MLINERPDDGKNLEFDNEASLREADCRLGLKRLMEQYNVAPPNGQWKSFVCPFCQKKKKSARVSSMGGVDLFKCYSASCPTGAKAMGAVQFLAFKENLSNKDAFIVYLKQAGVWKDRSKFPRTPGGGPPAAQPPPDAPGAPADPLRANSEPGPGSMLPGESPGAPGTSPSEVETSLPAHETNAGPAAGAPSPPSGPPPGASISPAPDAAPAGAPSNAEAASSKLPGADAPDAPGAGAPLERLADDPDGWRSLREFYSRLTLSDADADLLKGKRGLFAVTTSALRFRSNPMENKELLIELHKKYGLEEMLASGLWVPRDKRTRKPDRPNAQFFGAGIMRKLKPGEKAARHQWADEDGNLWGWVNPILIPYFDEAGELIALRPHKGGGRANTLVGTPHLYIPRGVGGALDGAAEVFYRVLITEGEFKGSALWQVLGAGRSDGEQPFGVAAIPGINFGKHYEVREVLDDWLRRVKCREVIVIFDNEEKGDPNLESYKAQANKRWEAKKWATYLACDLARKLHLRGKISALPDSWRNEKGKADWDGAMAEIYRGQKLERAK